ncbi:MAG: hypothetical protein E6H10_17665 [Bacteroidetes bacterium]|nr:MAG: hypothetical protein E6H10_17665 [Bacteroidota bacterium]
MSSAKKLKTYKQKKTGDKISTHQKSSLATVKPTKTQGRTSRKGSQRPLLTGSWKLNAGLFLLFVVATLLLYAVDLHLDFFKVDDQQYVVQNPWIKSVTAENINHILTTPYFVNYSPLHLFSYMLDYAINGLDPYTFHLSSNIWAGLVAGFVFLTALALTNKHIMAISAATLFVLHPVHVEAITWIASRKDLVATAFALPALLAYLKYRRAGASSTPWYIFSLVLFLFALAGKLSVATFPLVFIALDLFVEKRPIVGSLTDKIPYFILAGIMALIVTKAQPATGSHPDPYILLSALLQNLWLITGFGKYVIYRVAPVPQGMGLEILATMLLILIFVAPLLLRRKFPLAVVLIYWILFAFVPTQILSFAYPVTDRYLFFPSVAAVTVLAWAVISVWGKFTRKSLIPSLGLLVVVAVIWGINTMSYLHEWTDPRSVWYGASKKSSDPLVYYNLGWDYMDHAAQFGSKARKAPPTKEEATRLAAKVWQDDPRLPALLSEWEKNSHDGNAEKAFVADLRKLAHAAYDQALATKGKHIMPDLFFHRGLLYLDEGKMTEAKEQFMKGIDEASRSSYTQGSQEVLLNCHFNLGVVYWAEQNYPEALKWMTMVRDERTRFGSNLFPDINTHIQRLQQMIQATMPK